MSSRFARQVRDEAHGPSLAFNLNVDTQEVTAPQ
jgi:hypothetical protein